MMNVLTLGISSSIISSNDEQQRESQGGHIEEHPVSQGVSTAAIKEEGRKGSRLRELLDRSKDRNRRIRTGSWRRIWNAAGRSNSLGRGNVGKKNAPAYAEAKNRRNQIGYSPAQHSEYSPPGHPKSTKCAQRREFAVTTHDSQGVRKIIHTIIRRRPKYHWPPVYMEDGTVRRGPQATIIGRWK